MPATLNGGYQDLTATGRYSINVGAQGPGDNVGQLSVGTYATTTWTTTATIQANPFTSAQDPNGLGWQNIQAIRLDTGAWENTPTLTANTARSWKFNCLGFQQVAFNVTAITGDIPTSLSTDYQAGGIGLVQTQAVSQAVTGTLTVTGTLALADTTNVTLATTTGTKIGTATTQKLGFFNATPVVQPIASTDATTGAAGGTSTVYLNTTFTGAGGTAAYTIGGIATALKALGLLAP